MGLVDYGSSGGESSSESEDEGGPTITLNGVTTGPSKPSSSNVKNLQKVDTKFKTGSKNGISDTTEEDRLSLPAPRIEEKFLNAPEKFQEPDFHISDDEDDLHDRPSFLDQSTDEVAPESDIFSLISKKLPAAKKKLDNLTSLIDKNEDTSDIIKKVDYGGKIEEPPAKKKKSDGPVKISIPSLKQLKDEDPDSDNLPRPRVTKSAKGSGLMALLPDPKNKMTRNRPINVAKPETDDDDVPKSARQQELLAQEPVKNNLKPSGVRKSGLVPHILSKDFNPATFKPAVVSAAPMTAKASEEAVTKQKEKSTSKNFLVASDSDSDSGEEDIGINSGSYFPEDSTVKSGSSGLSKSSAPVYGLVRPKVPQVSQPIMPQDTNFISFDENPEDLGPAVSVYPPPEPSASQAQPNSLIDNEEALSRLAGKAAKRREFEDMQIIDINEDQMRGDPNVWLQKAMTEEQAPAPDRKGAIKGIAKSKHQITYLAHMAKEKDWELRQEWSQARANKRASMNKYGFC